MRCYFAVRWRKSTAYTFRDERKRFGLTWGEQAIWRPALHVFTSTNGTPANVTRAHRAPSKRATLSPSLSTSDSFVPA